jgi:hypothetical protein
MINVDVPKTVRDAVEARAKEMEKELGHASWGVDINAVLIIRLLRDYPPLKSMSDFFKAPDKGGKLKGGDGGEWATLLATLKVASNAAAINGSLRGYGKRTSGGAARAMDSVG